METLNTVAKQNADGFAKQEIMQIVALHKQQFEKAREIVTLKNNHVRIHFHYVYFLSLYFVHNIIFSME